ncbi:MAG: hypothetical protein IJE43_19280 [Alphaproteobacteria bacterium]|nr:hypothetical protein [Alphaproteobacteria bacterium]
MNGLLVACFVLWLITAYFQGFSIIVVGTLISTLIFCSRKIGHFCKFSTICILEGLSLFTGFMWSALWGSNKLSIVVITIICRAIYIGICYYDIYKIVYTKEIHRKETKKGDSYDSRRSS